MLDLLDTFFRIGAWCGFLMFALCGIVGAVIVYQAVKFSFTIAYYRFKYRQVRSASKNPAVALELTKIAEQEMEEEEKEEEANPQPKPNIPKPKPRPQTKPNNDGQSNTQTKDGTNGTAKGQVP